MALPVWGCPWHGLVKGGALALPNGQTMDFPQPDAPWDLPWLAGSTALIAHPAPPPIVRSPSEAAADTAAGREWRNTAILAGSELYGRNLGGWIYIDPAGDCWRVTTTLSAAHISGGTATFTLSRFGVMGGAPEQYSYNVTVPDMGQATPTIVGSSGSRAVRRYHSSPTGAAAVFEVSAEFAQDSLQSWRWRPIGWVEALLSGPGAACVISVIVRKTRAQTLGTAGREVVPGQPDNYWLQTLPDSVYRLVQGAQPPYSTAILSHQSVSGVASAGFSGYVVGVFYDAAGALHELTINEQALTTLDIPFVTHTGETEWVGTAINDFAATFTVTEAWSCTLTINYALDGVVVGSYSATVSETSTNTAVYDGNYSTSVTTNFSPGGSFSESASAPWTTTGIGGAWYSPFFPVYEAGEVPLGMGGGATLNRWRDSGSADGYFQPCPVRHSNQLFGLANWWIPESGTAGLITYAPLAVTPSGAATLPELVIAKNTARYAFDQPGYGSWCPVTGQAARDTAPVCWV